MNPNPFILLLLAFPHRLSDDHFNLYHFALLPFFHFNQTLSSMQNVPFPSDSASPYLFQRETTEALDTLMMDGLGPPSFPNGMHICYIIRILKLCLLTVS